MASENNYNFDHPNAFDFDLLHEVLSRLREGKSTEVPVYDFTTHSRDNNPKVCYFLSIPSNPLDNVWSRCTDIRRNSGFSS